MASEQDKVDQRGPAGTVDRPDPQIDQARLDMAGKVLELRRKGKTGPVIAKALGVSQSEVYDLFHLAVQRLVMEPAEETVKLEVIRLDKLLEAATVMVTSRKMDPTVKLRAIKTVLEIMDRRAKLLGLDQPHAVELSGPGGGAIATDWRLDLSGWLADESAVNALSVLCQKQAGTAPVEPPDGGVE